MNYQEFIHLSNPSISPIYAFELEDTTDRTLLLGHNHELNTCHLYIQDCKFKYIEYYGGIIHDDNEGRPISSKLVIIDTQESNIFRKKFIPERVIYPHDSDYLFCCFLKQEKYELKFNKFNFDRWLVNCRDSSSFRGRLIGNTEPMVSLNLKSLDMT
jgi:hypothetical protein